MSIEQAIKSIHKMGITTKSVINIMYTSRYVEDAIVSKLKPYEISLQQYNVLRILRGQGGKPANLSTIQERMVDRSSNTTRLVDKLIKKGWAERCVCEHNRRKVEITITNKGLELLKDLDPITEQNNRAILHNLSEEELITLNTLLDKLRDNQ
ncbi:MAG: MarR family transcriptional regulator [Flavobacteriales bacterium]|jgi:DNA-binding MarR family transcriptional regulator|uniref:MarR family winged helix-turn-helix transcriptional regulator n=1 Tax=Candidatus Ulvibacter alkanivorans TaxID=2267620 RepID=UPI000DF2D669|nr:MarR family transcriptional regulator [Candidatus Ulvibacter alkanivorans]MCH2491012.1 MarR family transcriptional regulator [Flavobacteriales bacterium]